MPTVLVTGGAGYIGSHTCVELLQAGYDILVVDNLANSHAASLDRVREITGKDFPFIQADLRDRDALDDLFKKHAFHAVVHFAGLKAVGESVEIPLAYYDNNVAGSLNLFDAMAKHGQKTLVFSSSATVYGVPATLPIKEDFPLSASNPYGRTKLMIEEILRDVVQADPTWRVALLRYFNPVGAHESGRIGESPNGIPNNLMPYIAQVASGRRPHLKVFGNDYATRDGTGVRDYIHVVDLAQGHLMAIEKLGRQTGIHVWNLGTGTGFSVLEMVAAFEAASGKPVPYQIAPRRSGDVAECYADPEKAWRELGWKAKRNLYEMCVDTWRWQSMNPDGYPRERS